MIRVNGKWFHDSNIEIGNVYTVSRTDSMSLEVGDKYTIISKNPATVNLPNFGVTSGYFVEIRKATEEEIERENAEIKERSAKWQNHDPR